MLLNGQSSFMNILNIVLIQPLYHYIEHVICCVFIDLEANDVSFEIL